MPAAEECGSFPLEPSRDDDAVVRRQRRDAGGHSVARVAMIALLSGT
jgi:hypothetical protein